MITFITNLYQVFSTGQIAQILSRLEFIMFLQSDTAQRLIDIKTTLVKVSGEFTAKITALETALATAGQTAPEVVAAIDDLKGIADALDALNPDPVVDPAPVDPAPVDPAPVDPAPVDPV